MSTEYRSVLSRGLTGEEQRVYLCVHSWVTDDIHIWIYQHSTSHYTVSVIFFVVRVDINSEKDHALKTVLRDKFVQNVN